MFFKSKNNNQPLNENELKQKIISGRIKIADLDLNKRDVFDTCLLALSEYPVLAKNLDPAKELEKKLIISWLKNKSLAIKNIDGTVYRKPDIDEITKISNLDSEKYLTDEKYDNDIIKAHLTLVTDDSRKEDDVVTYQSFKNDLVIKFNLETTSSEEVVYLDKELDVPVSLAIKFNLNIKIKDPYKFVKYLDVSIQQINFRLIYTKLTPVIFSVLRSVTLKIINDKKLCYYEINGYYREIANLLLTELQKTFTNSGLEFSEAFVISTHIPNNVDGIFEKQKIQFMQREKKLNLDHQAELLALENYEKKAAIHSKYPSYELGLTEREKDNAIERYLTKKRGYSEASFESPEEVDRTERDTKVGPIRKIKEAMRADDTTNDTKSSSIKYILGIGLGVLLFIIGIILAVVSKSSVTGVIMATLGVILTGVTFAGYVNGKNKNTEQATTNINKDTLTSMQENANEDVEDEM